MRKYFLAMDGMPVEIPAYMVGGYRQMADRVWAESDLALSPEGGLGRDVARYVLAHVEAGLLTPPASAKQAGYEFAYLFPWLESVHELQSALQLARFGFYRHAADGLRGVLELGVMSVYYGSAAMTGANLQRWYESDDKTPFWRVILERLFEFRKFLAAETRIHLRRDLIAIYGELCDYAHSRGLRFSARGQYPRPLAGCQFSLDSLKSHVVLLGRVVRALVALQLLKYPIGMQSLPVRAKFGPDKLMQGFVDESGKLRMTTVLDTETVTVLQELSDADEEVAETVRQFHSLPDLTEVDVARAKSVFQEPLRMLDAMGERCRVPDMLDPIWRYVWFEMGLGSEWILRHPDWRSDERNDG